MNQSSHYTYYQPSKECGATLIASLLILMVMTLISVTAMQSSILEEKMAGNQRDRELAFHAAETALLDAQAYIEELSTTTIFTVNNSGFYSNGAPNQLISDDAFDVDSACSSNCISTIFPLSASYSTIPGVAQQPRVIIELFDVIESQGAASLNASRYGSRTAEATVNLFRITVRSVGGTTKSPVFLQSYYGKAI